MTDIKIMEKIYDYKFIITKNELILILECLVSNYNIKVIETNVSSIIARYYDRTNKLYINYDNFINVALVNLDKNKINTNNIKYINYKIVQLLFHELEHIKQFNNKDLLLVDSNQKEIEYKKNKTYSYHLYMCNPLERLADINSLNKVKEYLSLINKNNISNYFELEYLTNILYGYFINEYNYPINIFFNTQDIINYDDYEAPIIGCSLSNDEYLKMIDQKKLTLKKMNV